MLNITQQFGRISSIECMAIAGIIGLCGHIAVSRLLPTDAHEDLRSEVAAMEAANTKRNQLDRLSLNLNLIYVDGKTEMLPETDCKLVREFVGKPQRLLAEFLVANDKLYSYQQDNPMTATRREHDANAMRYSAQESDRMIARRLEICGH